MGEAFSQARNSSRSACEREPARCAMYQSAAIWVIAKRMDCADGVMFSLQPCHATTAMGHRESQIFLNHVRRYLKLLGDLLVGQSMLVLHEYRGPALGRQLGQNFTQASDARGGVE